MSKILLKGRYYRLYPPEKYLGHLEEVCELDSDSTAFLLVDVYGAAFPEDMEWKGVDMSYVLPGEDEVIRDHIRPALEAARSIGLPIVYVNNSAPRIAMKRSAHHRQRYKHTNIWHDEMFVEDNIDPLEYHYGEASILEISPIIAPRPEDYFIRKWVYSGFFDTRLDSLLRNLGVKTLVTVGFGLDFCLLGTVLDAVYRNYDVFLLRDCTLAVDLPEEGEVENHTWTRRMILWFENAVGVTATSEDWVAACQAAKG